MEIGMQIVKKCDGLPLAIKSIGGVLCTKGYSRGNWQAVLRSNVWSMDGLSKDVHHALYLSYEDLPPTLKQCFVFCSLFPEDFEFNKTNLIFMWLAEGFLQDKEDFWELGNEYYAELLLRNFLEDTYKYYNQEQCKMHDLLWSFARQLGKDENYVLREGQVLSGSEGSIKVRRLSIEGNEVNTKVIKKEKGLRTLLLYSKSEIALVDMCKASLNLRILDLSWSNSNFSSLPDSLGNLVHLRYLNVSNSKLGNIPNSIGNLRKLVYFSCSNCKELSYFPQRISNLRELRYLNFRDTKVEAVPMGLNNLEKLYDLYGFKPYKNSLEGFSSLDMLESLSQLISLWLEGLEIVSDRKIAQRANFVSKNQLQFLQLKYTSLSSEEQLSQTNERKMTTEDVLNELCPPCSLEGVTIEGYFGRCLPCWFNLGATLPNLRSLHISNCACFERLAPLGQLPNLNILRIKGAYSVVSVGEEFMQGDTKSKDPRAHAMSYPAIPAFPKLSELGFEGMPNWKEWQWNEGLIAMPKLKQLHIEACPELRSIPEGLLLHATSLQDLDVVGTDNLNSVENFSSIKDIRVVRNPILERISNLPGISYILIKECPNLKAVENLESLQRMEIIGDEMETLPEYLLTTMPQKLRIRCSEDLLLKIASKRESGSEWNRFKHISKVTIYSPDKSFYANYQKTPFSFTTNVKSVQMN
ncbi:putative disease resistance protein RGA3 [Carex littledalei]|uniref:Putative disease resistance protein RGA3 n=1 Tax=Carex littledalei TaxID=544730 RepID=A0A833RGJ0_9POAL|nr:putative disease resistance protein RGA3 [Carex littledalei]